MDKTKVNLLFKEVINKALSCVDEISNSKDKADIYCKVAAALASTGLIQESDDEVNTNNTQEVQEELEEKVEDRHCGSEDLVVREETKITKKRSKKSKNEKDDLVKKLDNIEAPAETEEQEEEVKYDSADMGDDEEVKAEIDDSPVDDEWSDEMYAKFEEEINFLNEFAEQNGEDVLNEVLVDFSSGLMKTYEDITPKNIKAVISYIKQLLADEAENC